MFGDRHLGCTPFTARLIHSHRDLKGLHPNGCQQLTNLPEHQALTVSQTKPQRNMRRLFSELAPVLPESPEAVWPIARARFRTALGLHIASAMACSSDSKWFWQVRQQHTTRVKKVFAGQLLHGDRATWHESMKEDTYLTWGCLFGPQTTGIRSLKPGRALLLSGVQTS